MLLDLLRGRLPDIDHGETVTVTLLDLFRAERCGRRRRQEGHGPPPPCSHCDASARSAGRSGPSGVLADRSAGCTTSSCWLQAWLASRTAIHAANFSRASWPIRGDGLNSLEPSVVPRLEDGGFLEGGPS